MQTRYTLCDRICGRLAAVLTLLALLCGYGQPVLAQTQYVSDQTISAENPDIDDFFGRSVRVLRTAGEEPILIVGASGVTAPDETIEGRAYIVDGSTGGTLQTLTSQNPTEQGQFGEAVGVVSDVTDDGVPDALVGAPREDVNTSNGSANNAGAAYIYDGETGALVHVLQSSTGSNITRGRRFGASIAGIGDVNGDDVPDVVVGAPSQEVSGASNAGKVYVFSGSDGSVLSVLTGSGTANGQYGLSLTGAGDLIGDGTEDFVVGAPGEGTGGQIYVVDGGSVQGTINSVTVASGQPESGGQFGASVASLGNGSNHDLLVGAPAENGDGIADAGRAYVIDGSTLGGTVSKTVLTSTNSETAGQFGEAVASLQDANGDGKPDALIGAPFETVNGASDAGRAYVYSSDTGVFLAQLSSPNPQTGRFGISLDGTSVPIIGAPRETVDTFGKAGRVYTFTPAVAFTDGRDGESYAPDAPTPGTDANPIGRLKLSAGVNGPVLTDITIDNSAPDPTGVDNVELWVSTNDTFDPSTDTQIAGAAYSSSLSFSGLSVSIPFDGSYVFLVVDLAANAGGDYEPLIVDETRLSFTGGVLNSVNGALTSTFTDAFLSDASTTLPVELAAFDANVEDDRSVRLQWQTTSETGNSGFRVQRSVSGTSWSTLGRVDGAGTTDEPQSYRFTDSSVPYASDSLQYRLAQVDVDGTVNVSDPVTVGFGNPDGLELLGSFPNPARSQATVRFAVPEQTTGDVQLELYDLLGRQVKTIPAAEASGRIEQTLDVSNLPSGTYLLRLSAGGQSQSQQVTIVR